MITQLPKVVITDLDGTIVRSDETVADRTRHVFKRLVEAGITVVGATGRGPRLLEWSLADHIPSAQYMVMAQGGFVFDVTDGQPKQLSSTTIHGETLRIAIEKLEPVIGPVHLVTEPVEHNEPITGDRMPVWPWAMPTETSTRDIAFAGEKVKLYFWPTGIDSDSVLEKALPLLENSPIGITESGVGMLELSPAGMEKSVGITTVLDRLDATWDEVLAFGDALNDFGMLENAGHAVSMPNGHKRIRAVATEIAPADNDNDGVAVYLENMLDQFGM